MSMQPIIESFFSIQPLNKETYQLTIQFSNAQGYMSKKVFTFCQQSTPEEGVIWDVLTKNGQCKESIVNTLFQKKDVKEAQQALSQLTVCQGSAPVVAVLDLQDAHTHYLPCEECLQTIEKCEEAVCDFFQSATPTSSKTGNKIYALFQERIPLDFLICEGSIKQDLLKCFEEHEIAYFNGTKTGALAFCQCAEFFMNGFKFGQIVRGDALEFSPEKYIKPISKQFQTFSPRKKSTVFYPALYKNTYAPEGQFASTLKQAFLVSGEYIAQHKITTMNVEMQ